MNARDLIRQRRAEIENKAVEHEVERSEQLERDHTGQPFKYVGRNPATGEIQISNGDVRLSAYSVSNSELTPNTELQVLDSGVGNPTVNFAPHHPRRPVEPPQSSEEFTGTYAVLLDSIVSGEATPSCRKLTDIWALFAIVQYVKAARVMVLFSFPVDTGSPVDYACPRYRFKSGSWTCDPTADVDASYDNYSACAAANPVTCPGGLYPPGLPLIDGYPSTPGCTGAGSSTSPGGTFRRYDYGDEYGVESNKTYQERFYTFDRPAYSSSCGSRSARKALGRYGTDVYPYFDEYGNVAGYEMAGYNPDNLLELNSNLVTSWTHRSIYNEFYKEKGRAPKCGDKITRTRRYIEYTVAPIHTVYDCDGRGYSTGGDFSVNGLGSETVTWSWQFAVYWSFLEVSYSAGCGNYNPKFFDGSSNPQVYTPPPPDPPECPPDEGEPSTYERQFWVGGHVQTPTKLISINAEEEYEYFGSLMPDGYYVTLKWGRKKVNGKEEWCKVQTFKTTNLVDWRTESYHESKELQPTKPSGVAGTLIDTKNDRANLTETALIEINPTQIVKGAGNINRTLNKELLTRPEGSFVNTQIPAKIDYTPNGGTKVQYNAPIYRIVQVIPAVLNTGTIGCIEVGQVELAYSPLFVIPT
jgi:hypothetical protein